MKELLILCTQPQTVGWWLLCSLSWTVLGLGGWWCLGAELARWPSLAPLEAVYLPLGFLLVHLLLWRYALLSGWPLLDGPGATEALGLHLAAYLWLLLLGLFQVLCAAGLLLGTLLLVC
jgi:hypothetical protein